MNRPAAASVPASGTVFVIDEVPMPTEYEDLRMYMPRTFWQRCFTGNGLAVVSFAWLFSCGVLWIASGQYHREHPLFAACFFGVTLGAPAFVAALVILLAQVRRLLGDREASPVAMVFSLGALAGGHLMHWVAYDVYLQHLYPHFFAHGRRLHRGREILAPRAEIGEGWIARANVDALDVPTTVRDAVAAQWRENAAKEHASIAAFAHLTLDLLAVGAPAELVEAAQRAATDECRHAELAYGLAAVIDGRRQSPAPFRDAFARRALAPQRDVALAQIATDALADGALNEGLAARILARLSKAAATPELGRLLSTLAADEARHARDSWDVIAWCVQAGGPLVARALTDARRSMPATLGSPLPAGARDGAWSPWGVQGTALEASEYAWVRRNAHERLTALLDERCAA